jgi:flagellar basal-body rod modification protein FlgD
MMATNLTTTLPAGIRAYDPAAASAAAVGKNTLGTSASETQDYFMKMLLAQIQNQDPLNAQDPAEMTSQLTQLNTASGIERLNGSINAMLEQTTAQSFMSNAALIGSQVLAAGDVLDLGVSGDASFGLKLAANSTQTTVKLLAADGRVVDELSLGALSAGMHTFTWDGAGYDGARADSGRYRLVAAASNGEGNPVATSSLTQGLVSAVTRTDTGAQLITADGRSLAPVDLFQLSKP